MNYTRPLSCDPALLEHIPGLKVTGSTVRGPRDAFAVAYTRTGSIVQAPALEFEPANIDGLREYQKYGVGWLVAQLRASGGALLADDMGLGKTLQTIRTWQQLGSYTPLLVVCPASVRRGWVKEFKKWADVDVELLETGKQAAKVGQHSKVVVTSYDLAQKLPAAFIPNMLVMDEAQNLRGRSAKRSRHILELSKSIPFKLALTGTPMWSRPRDLWMILRILFGYRFGTADDFDYAYCGASINKWGGKDNHGATRVDELKKRMEFIMLRRLKRDVAKELPPITREMLWVPAAKEATKALEAFALKQMSFGDALNATLDAKVDATVDACIAAGKFLLFTWQKRHAELFAEKLGEAGFPVEVLSGDYTHAERAAAIDRAQKSGASVVATIDSTNAGVDGLQEIADTAIFHSLDWVPIKVAQAEARLHRIGQKNPVTCVYVALTDSADQVVVETVIEKLEQWTNIMGQDDAVKMHGALSGSDAGSEEAALAAIYAAMGDEE